MGLTILLLTHLPLNPVDRGLNGPQSCATHDVEEREIPASGCGDEAALAHVNIYRQKSHPLSQNSLATIPVISGS